MDEKKRGFWWWITAILTPIGLIGGPIQMAQLAAGVVQWHGVFGFVVQFWDVTVSQPFHLLFQSFYDLLVTSVHFPKLHIPKLASDYLSFGIIVSGLFLRSLTLAGVNSRSNIAFRVFVTGLAVIVWPIFILLVIIVLVVSINVIWFDVSARGSLDDHIMGWAFYACLLVIIPVLIFLGLLIANYFLGHAQIA